MQVPVNNFKKALSSGDSQLGIWASFADPYATEAIATVGADWLLIDGEHGPNDVRSILAQLQAVAPYASHPVVRVVDANPAVIKQVLDIGAQTLMVPMIDTAEQARAVVAATRYPPNGIRGVGAALGRASRWTSIPDYADSGVKEICVIVQVESVKGISNIEEIVSVDGVDGVFFGPVDLSASMDLMDQPTHPDVVKAIEHGTSIARAAGKAAGVLATDVERAKGYLAAGVQFAAVGIDILMLINSGRALLRELRGDADEKRTSYG
ncbi:2,4-dihydroxyhept-2-ene-1,7-dioic acid aldolase [Acetobacter nitrogenifigens DSM 23921 = NBRC 105050]|uniref:2,4-dihydroxyhept-2-ene-1,7-dioic acid aldolase n=1 Tax=Acetobacter nitrogenifigens DSM 23921 = NBRC 105050 TaxID=1120919 RepID=A0A511X998_9PROT|nr:aldolase/citrate lyase family protein [Acetobacter nitrogenifigens]GBQ93217.1 2,4-dihydroxyhept-2-ene-1,7-dioic acid aldolase [Acetobacter nitrogenifigens DSM 23921 = NBRC 105050]GEN59502.1 2,4-dihydroxyhept-2-ene-1,7-dioic acid aldolase [Acetobacter nitrogenifigens DSM 23921 = NBRC 105050]